MFALKAIRHAICTALETPAPEIVVNGVVTPVTVVRNPPGGGWINEDTLPGVFVYTRADQAQRETYTSWQRDVRVDLVLQAKGSADVLDQIDDMHELFETRLMTGGQLGGLVLDIAPESSEIHVERGAVVFGARRVTFAVKALYDPKNPTLTP